MCWGFEGAHGGNGFGKRNVERRLLEFCDEKKAVRGEHVVSKRQKENNLECRWM